MRNQYFYDYITFAVGFLHRMGDCAEKLSNLQHIPGGSPERNLLCRATLGQTSVVLKTRTHHTLDESSELFGNQQSIDGLAPRLLFSFHPDELREKALVLRELDSLARLEVDFGRTFVFEEVHTDTPEAEIEDEDVVQMAHLVRTLHSTQPNEAKKARFPSHPKSLLFLCETALSEMDMFDCWEKATGEALFQAFDCLQEHFRKHIENRGWKSPKTLIHGDLRWHNSIKTKDGQRMLIDFEHAGVADPLLDIALFSCRTPLSSEQELLFLETYFAEEGDSTEIERYFMLLPFVRLASSVLGALHCFHHCQDTNIDESYRKAKESACGQELYRAVSFFHAEGKEETGFFELCFRQKKQPYKTLASLGNNQRLQVAIDGGASCLKTPVASEVATITGCAHYNFGALFRLVTLLCICKKVKLSNPKEVTLFVKQLEEFDLGLLPDGSASFEGRRYQRALQSLEVEKLVASLAALPAIRKACEPIFARVCNEERVVVEGRNIGEYWLPETPNKFFLTASIKERCRLFHDRYSLSSEEATTLLQKRDQIDSARASFPFSRSEDAIVLEVSKEDFDRVMSSILSHIKETK